MSTYAKNHINCDEHETLSLTVMIIGAVKIEIEIEIEKTMSDESAVTNLLAACRRESGFEAGGI